MQYVRKVLKTKSQAAEERFAQEINISKFLEGEGVPQVVRVLGHGRVQGHLYYDMPYYPNGTLRSILSYQFEKEEVLLLFKQIIVPVYFAHKKGFVHRDLKEDNIIFDADYNVIICDWGLAKGPSSPQLTAEDVVPGTKGYIPPFHWADGFDHDVYSLGIIFSNVLSSSLFVDEFKPVSSLPLFNSFLTYFSNRC